MEPFRVTICGTDSCANLGDQAIILSIMEAVDRVTGRANRYRILTRHPEIARERLRGCTQIETVASVAWQPSHNKWLSNVRDLFIRAGLSTLPQRRSGAESPFSVALELMRGSDVVILTGGRYLNSPYFKAILSRYLDVIVCRRAGVPVCGYSQSVGPFVTFREQAAARRLIGGLSFISPRDEKSLKFLAEFGVPAAKVVFAPDSVFRLPPASPEAAEEFLKNNGVGPKAGGVRIAVSARPLISMIKSVGGETKRNYLESLARYIDEAPPSHEFAFLSSTYRAAAYKRHDPDVGHSIKEALRNPERLTVIEAEPPAPVLKAAYGLMDLVVTTRMHPIIMSAGMATPVISIAYEYKCREMMRLIGMEEYCVELSELSAETLARMTEKAVGESGGIRARLQERLPVLQEQALAPAYRIKELLERR